jgi:hypothetical protein
MHLTSEYAARTAACNPTTSGVCDIVHASYAPAGSPVLPLLCLWQQLPSAAAASEA